MASRTRRTRQRAAPSDSRELQGYSIEPQLIGKGGYSEIWRASSKNCPDLQIVAKVTRKTARRSEINYLNELTVLKKLSHPNIVKLVHYQETDSNYYILIEYHGKPTLTLTELLQNNGATLELPVAINIFSQVASAIAYMHSCGFGHRDIKPDNILYNPINGHVTLIDFGFAYRTYKRCEEYSGSPLYSPPEVLSMQPYDIEMSDCWSLGVVLFQTLYGRTPFEAKSLEELTHCISNHELKFPDELLGSRKYSALKDVISRLLTKNPDHRMTAHDLNAFLQEFVMHQV